jgi:hypothetical protein
MYNPFQMPDALAAGMGRLPSAATVPTGGSLFFSGGAASAGDAYPSAAAAHAGGGLPFQGGAASAAAAYPAVLAPMVVMVGGQLVVLPPAWQHATAQQHVPAQQQQGSTFTWAQATAALAGAPPSAPAVQGPAPRPSLGPRISEVPAPRLQELAADMEAELRKHNASSAFMRDQAGAGPSGSAGRPVFSYVPRGSRSGALVGAPGGIGSQRHHRRALQHFSGGISGGSSSFAEFGGHSEQMLEFSDRHCRRWDDTCDAMVADMCACGWCGRPGFGGGNSELRAHMRPRPCEDTPPAVLANPGLLHLAGAGDGHMWACGACAGSSKRREEQAQRWQVPIIGPSSALGDTPLDLYYEMLGMLMALPVGGGLQLSVLRCAVRFAQRVAGYVHVLEPEVEPNLLGGPLMDWASADLVRGTARACACNVWAG